MLQNIPKCFLIIDGVDECAVEERRPLLEFLNEIVNICDSTDPGKVRILILSREEPDIKNMLVVGRVLRLTPKDTLRDVEHFVHHKAIRVQENFKLNDEDRAYIEQNVLDRTEGTISFPIQFSTIPLTDIGMFLYAKLVMLNLESQPSLRHLQRELEPNCFPKGLNQA